MKSDRKTFKKLDQIKEYVAQGNSNALANALNKLNESAKNNLILPLERLAIDHEQPVVLNFLLSIQETALPTYYLSLFARAGLRENKEILDVLKPFLNHAYMNNLLKILARQGKIVTVEYILSLENVSWKLNKKRAVFLALSTACTHEQWAMADKLLGMIKTLPAIKPPHVQAKLDPFQHQAAMEYIAQKDFALLYDLFPLFNKEKVHVLAIDLAKKHKLMADFKKIIQFYLAANQEILGKFSAAVAVNKRLPLLKHLLTKTEFEDHESFMQKAFLHAVDKGQCEVIIFLLNYQPEVILTRHANAKLVFEDLLDRMADEQRLLERAHRFEEREQIKYISKQLEIHTKTARLLLAYGAGIGLNANYLSFLLEMEINIKNCIMLGAEITENNISKFTNPCTTALFTFDAFKDAVLGGLVFSRSVVSAIINSYLNNEKQNKLDNGEHADKKARSVSTLPQTTLLAFEEAAKFLSAPSPLKTQALSYLSLHRCVIPPHTIPEELSVAIENVPQMSPKFTGRVIQD